MKFLTLSTTSALVAIANAHTTIWNIYVNDVNQGVGNSAAGYIRTPPNNNPVKDITSNNLTCNVNNVATAKTVTAAAGDKITVEWHHNDNTASDDIIASSHKGPILVYIAPTASDGAGNVWVKLAESGYNSGTWAVDTLIANKGQHSFTLPSVLAPGNYLVRPEIIALHEADAAYNVNPARGAQFYMECIQLQVTGNGGTTLPAGVAIPGAYKYTDPGVVFNLYGTFTSYTIPGPAVWNAASSGVSGSSATSPAPSISSTPAAAASPSTVPAVSTSTYYSCSTTMSTVVGSAPTGSSIAGTGAVAKWSQCGGKGYTGGSTCVSGTTCQVVNDYYSQCL